jgi:phage-related protein
VKTPPFSKKVRVEAGYLLRLLQEGERLRLPESRPMPAIGANCHELRLVDETTTWRILYALTSDAVVITRGLREEEPCDAKAGSTTWRKAG